MEDEREPTGPKPGPGGDDTPPPDDAFEQQAEFEDDFDLEDPDAAAEGSHTALPGRVEAWRRRSAAGAILTGFALGLQEALETRKEEPSIVMETSGDPPKDLPVEAEFEYGRPRQSVVQIRPWLLPDAVAGADAGGTVNEARTDAPDQAAGESGDASTEGRSGPGQGEER